MTENREPERREIDTGGGRYVENIGTYIEQFVIKLFGDEGQIPVKRDSIQQKLLNSVSQEVAARFDYSLYDRSYILLDKEEDISQIELLCEEYIKTDITDIKKLKPLPSETKIIDIYDQDKIKGRFLILGAPGSGKTTTLLQLAQVLINRAQDDINQPIPVLLNLSSWKKDKQSIKDWIIDDMHQKYGVDEDDGEKWLEKAVIIPLLDGLDEIASARQGLCVEKINDFLEFSIWSSPLVVCSRSEEYQLLSDKDQSRGQIKKLNLNSAVILRPLTQKQIKNYLRPTEEEQLWQSFKENESLMELAKTPLLLNIIVTSWSDINLSELQKLSDSKQRLSCLLNVYIQKMLKRKSKRKRAYEKKQPRPEYNKTKTIWWLRWLAIQLNQENRTEFLIEDMQPCWLNSKKKELVYWVLLGLFFSCFSWSIIALLLALFFNKDVVSLLGLINGINGLFFGLFFGLISQKEKTPINSERFVEITDFLEIDKHLVSGLISGVISGLIFGLIFGLILKSVPLQFFGPFLGLVYGFVHGLVYAFIVGEKYNKIEPVEKLNFSWLRFKRSFIVTKQTLSDLFHFRSEVTIVEIFMFIFGPVLVLILALIGGTSSVLYGARIDLKIDSNQGIKQSLKNFITLLIIWMIVLYATDFFVQQIINYDIWLLNISLIIFLGLAIVLSLSIMLKSSLPAIQHFTLRLILYSNGYIPWNYACFLNYATERLLLQRVGGRYRFIHRLVQKHFAQM